MPPFKPGQLIHDEDMGLGIVDGPDREADPEFGNVYRVTGIPGQSECDKFLAREGTMMLVTREMVEEESRS